MTEQPPSSDNPPSYAEAVAQNPAQRSLPSNIPNSAAAGGAGQDSQGGNLGHSFQDQYPHEGDLSLGLQFDSPGASQGGTESYPGQSWLPPGHRYPTGAGQGSESAPADVPENYPGKSWLPLGHVYPPPKQGPTLITHTMVVHEPGNCPKCRLGWVEDRFTPCGILLGVMFFPLGILCCLMLREYRCSYCGAEFTLEELEKYMGEKSTTRITNTSAM